MEQYSHAVRPLSRLIPREAEVEEEFYRLAMNVLEKNDFVIEGVKFAPLKPQFSIDGGRADLMLPTDPFKPLLIIECKRKRPEGIAERISFDPMSSRVINQALNYAVLCGAQLFATTNGKVFALFTKPKQDEPFRIDRQRLLIREMDLKEEVVEEILRLVARWKAGLAITKTPVDWAFILRLRSFVDYLSQQLVSTVKEMLKTNKAFREEFDRFVRDFGEANEESFAREAAYILMNKLIFHKILERYYCESGEDEADRCF